MSKQVTVRYEFGGLLSLLAVLFIALKLTGYIAWSWLWVLAPLWGPFALVISIAGLLLIWAFVVLLAEAANQAYQAKKRRRNVGQFGS